MEHQLHYNARLDFWAWAVFPVNRMRHIQHFRFGDYVIRNYTPYRHWNDMAGDLAWWEAAQLFGGGN